MRPLAPETMMCTARPTGTALGVFLSAPMPARRAVNHPWYRGFVGRSHSLGFTDDSSPTLYTAVGLFHT